VISDNELGDPKNERDSSKQIYSVHKNSTLFKSFTQIENDLVESMTIVSKEEKNLLDELVLFYKLSEPEFLTIELNKFCQKIRFEYDLFNNHIKTTFTKEFERRCQENFEDQKNFLQKELIAKVEESKTILESQFMSKVNHISHLLKEE